MTHKKFFRIMFPILAFSFLCLISIGCGGVSKNPAEPPWKKDQTDQTKTGQAATDQEKEQGAPEIKPNATPEELVDTAKTALEGGFIRTAAQAYSQALDTQKDKPDLVLAYAIIKIAGSVKEFSILMSPGINYVYYNTPLIGRQELLPTPMNEDDSYLLRLASLGASYVQPFSAKVSKPVTPPPPGGATVPGKEPKSPSGEKGTPTPPGAGGENPPLPTGGEGSSTSKAPGGERQAAGIGVTGGGKIHGENSGNTQTGNPSGTGGGGGGGMQYAGTPGQPKVEYLQLDKDIFPDHIKQYKDIARTYNSGYLSFDAVDTTITDLKAIIDDLVDKLEFAKKNIEPDKFALEIPFKLDDKPGAMYRIYFKDYDYQIILGYLKLLQGELTYRSAYNSSAAGMTAYTTPEDKDKDNKLTPAEYYPASPYGTKTDKAKDTLAESSTLITDATGILVKNLDAFHSNDKLTEYAGNLLFPVNIDQALLDKVANERSEYSDFEVLLTAGKGTRSFTTPAEPVKADVDLAFLFGENAPASVSALLPTLDAQTYEPVAGADGKILPDPSWGGLFTTPVDNFDVFRISSDVSGSLTLQGEALKDVQIKLGADTVKTDEKGKFTLKDVKFNELTGFTVDVTAPSVQTPIKAQIRGAWVSFDLSLLNPSMGGTSSTGEGGTVVTAPGGGAASTPGAGGGSASRIDDIKKKKEEEKKKKEESGGSGDNPKTETPPKSGEGSAAK